MLFWGLHYWGASMFYPFQFITYMFMHGDLGHLIFNMFALWMFGATLENYWGAKRFLFFYFFTGIGAAIVHYTVFYFQISPTLEMINAYLEAPDFTFSNVGNFVYNELDNEFYFTYNGAVYRVDTGIDAFPSTAFINQSFYGLGYDPIEDALIGLEAPDFSSSGNLIYFDDNGNSTKTFTVGIGPNSIVLD